MTVRVVKQILDVQEIHRQLHSKTSGGVARDMLRRGLRVQTAAKKNAPADTGRLRGSIEMATVSRSVLGVSTFVIVVGTNVEYALYVHGGTGVHGPTGEPITARTAGRLVFKSRDTGRLIRVFSVQGQRGVPYLKDAIVSARG